MFIWFVVLLLFCLLWCVKQIKWKIRFKKNMIYNLKMKIRIYIKFAYINIKYAYIYINYAYIYIKYAY